MCQQLQQKPQCVNMGVKELRELARRSQGEDVVAMHAGELRTHTTGHLKGNNKALFVHIQVVCRIFIVSAKLSLRASFEKSFALSADLVTPSISLDDRNNRVLGLFFPEEVLCPIFPL